MLNICDLVSRYLISLLDEDRNLLLTKEEIKG